MPPDLHAAASCSAAVEALAGLRLHKQNFRRLIEQQGLVEETGELTTDTGGRPAKLYRFRREICSRARRRRHQAAARPLRLTTAERPANGGLTPPYAQV